MNTFRRRLTDIEERKAFRECVEAERMFEGRSQDELIFFAVYGYFPEAAAGEVPQSQEFTIGGIRTIITPEKVSS